MAGNNEGATIVIKKPIAKHQRKDFITALHPVQELISSIADSDDTSRKMSNDSGVSVASSRPGKDSPDSSIAQNSELIGEPKLSTLQNFFAQQSLAGVLNPALLGLQSNPFSVNPWYPLLLMQQQEALNGKSNQMLKQMPKDVFNVPIYNPMMPFFSNPNTAIPSAMEEMLKAQMTEFYKYQNKLNSPSVDDHSEPKIAVRKSNSYSDAASPQFQRRNSLSPPNNDSISPVMQPISPPKNSVYSADERTCSSYQDDDDHQSVTSGKSSTRSFDSKSPNSVQFQQSIESQGKSYQSQAGRKESARRRKIGVVGSTISDLGLSLFPREQTAASHQHANSPSEKLSTASLPANLSSARNGNSRKRPRTLPDEEKDEVYWERRRKNNEAAKRSRDSRRAKEDEVAIRAAFLEQENIKLRVEMTAMHQELSKLKNMLSECQKKKNYEKDDKCKSPPESPNGSDC